MCSFLESTRPGMCQEMQIQKKEIWKCQQKGPVSNRLEQIMTLQFSLTEAMEEGINVIK